MSGLKRSSRLLKATSDQNSNMNENKNISHDKLGIQRKLIFGSKLVEQCLAFYIPKFSNLAKQYKIVFNSVDYFCLMPAVVEIFLDFQLFLT